MRTFHFPKHPVIVSALLLTSLTLRACLITATPARVLALFKKIGIYSGKNTPTKQIHH